MNYTFDRFRAECLTFLDALGITESPAACHLEQVADTLSDVSFGTHHLS